MRGKQDGAGLREQSGPEKALIGSNMGRHRRIRKGPLQSSAGEFWTHQLSPEQALGSDAWPSTPETQGGRESKSYLTRAPLKTHS